MTHIPVQNWKNHVSYDSDTPLALKQGQGHETWYKLEALKQSGSDARFEKSWRVTVKKPTIKFLPNQEARQLSPLILYESQK